VYLRSFADSDGDGVGDLPGLVSKLDHLQWLGVDAVWCSPVTVSPDRDFGYDVANYRDVQPGFGSLDDMRRLLGEAGGRGMQVLLDIVPNHTSDQHPWFSDPAKRDWYVWADRPNNWISHFGGSAWEHDAGVGRWYLHNYLKEMPDLNWWNEEVRAEFDRILRFWFDLGVAGFRIDVAHGIVKDRLLRDNPPAGPQDSWLDQRRGQRFIYNQNRPEAHEVLRRWRRVAGEYDPPRVLLGETFVLDVAQMASFYGGGDELQLALNFPFMFTPFEPAPLRAMTEATLAELGPGTPVWHGSNHDVSRFPTRWCQGDERLVRMALTMLLTLPGACVLYQGDEIGMEDVEVPYERSRDPRPEPRRDRSRTPMPWNAEPNGGFTTGEPWLPMGDHRRVNVATQREDPASVLHHTRRLIQLRKSLRGPYEPLPSGPSSWRYRRSDAIVDLDFESVKSEVG
jgi:alpha-glucosidase